MDMSFNLYVLQSGSYEVLTVDICKDGDKKRYVEFDKRFLIKKLRVKHLKDCVRKEVYVDIDIKLKFWKLNGIKLKDIKEQNISTEEDIVQNLHGEEMQFDELFSTYFQAELDKLDDEDYEPVSSIITIIPATGPSQQVLEVFEKEEVLRKAESHWTNLKDGLVKKIELEEFKVSDHIYKDSINASGIPMINKRPSFILHSLPDSDNEEGYLHKETLTALLNNVMESPWLFLLGTSGSGKTRSLYELLCKTFGIYLSLSAGNGSKNLGSEDLDLSIVELRKYLTGDHEENTDIALKFTRAILLSRLFILNKLLIYNRGCNRNFTPKQWLLIQLLPRKTGRGDFWVSISQVFRELKQKVQDELISTFIEEFHTLIPQQEKLPIAIDESQVAITMYEKHFSTTLVNGTLRPFFYILLRTVTNLSAGRLCLILSGTGISFDDINNYTASAIAKSDGATFKNFFSMHDGFYECDEMSKFIQRFLPLNDELIRATFDIFRGRRRFIVKFLEYALLDSSLMSQSNMNQIVKNWQDSARISIINSFMKLCFPRLREKKEVWNKVLDIVVLSMFSQCEWLMRGSGVSEMVQYGFAQLCSFKNLVNLDTLEQNAITTVQIAEPIPILAYREYFVKNPEEYETHLFQKLGVDALFKPCCTIPLTELFNAKTCKEHDLFTTIENIDKLGPLLSCKTTIRNFDNRNSTKICSNGNEVKLPSFLENPTTAFFMPEKEAGPDLVCIVEFHTPSGIVEIPLFLQAKLVKKSPGAKVKDTTNPYYFYPHGKKRTMSKQRLRDKVLACLKSKYCKAHELSWIRFIVVFPAKVKAESKYIINDKDPRPRGKVASYNDSKANELLIVIDPSNIEHFFSKFGCDVLVNFVRTANDDEEENDELELEPEENDELGQPEKNDELKLEPEEKELKRIADNDELKRETKMVRISDD